MTLMNGRGWGRANRMILLQLPLLASAQHETAQKSLVIGQKEIKGILHAESSMEKKSHCL